MNKKNNEDSTIQTDEKLKERQKEIILLIYRYRFLNRVQIQSLLSHKHHNRLNIWLNELSENKYLIRYYSKTIAANPAIYSLGSKGRKYLRTHAQEFNIQISLLDRIWYEKTTTNEFRNRMQFVGDIYMSLFALTKTTEATLKFYTTVDLKGINHLPGTLPEGFFSITEKTGTSKRFFLIIFKPYPIEKDLIKKVFMYFSYYKKRTWQKNNTHPFPEIIFICSEKKTFYFLKGMIKKGLKKEPSIVFSLAMQNDIKKNGINKKVLEKVTI